MCLHTQDLQQFNEFFIEKEEECIIRTQALEEQLAKVPLGASIGKLRSAFVDLHGAHLTLAGWTCLPRSCSTRPSCVFPEHECQRCGV